MIQSLIYLKKEVSNTLKVVGHYDKCLKTHEWATIEELSKFLESFSSLTELVSTRITSLSLIPLIPAEVTDSCKPNGKDCNEVKAVKQLIMKNLDKRLPMTNATILATLMDPSTKVLVEMTDAEKERFLYNATVSESTRCGNDVSETAAEEVETKEEPGVDAIMSKKQKLLQKHAPSPRFPADDRLREEIRKYLAYKPSDDEVCEDDPLVFWKKRKPIFPLLEPVANTERIISSSGEHVFNDGPYSEREAVELGSS